MSTLIEEKDVSAVNLAVELEHAVIQHGVIMASKIAGKSRTVRGIGALVALPAGPSPFRRREG